MRTDGWCEMRLTCCRISVSTEDRKVSLAGYMEHAYIMSCQIRMPNSSAIYGHNRDIVLLDDISMLLLNNKKREAQLVSHISCQGRQECA